MRNIVRPARKKPDPEGPVVFTWYDLSLCEAAATDPLMIELIRLARVGFVAEAHSVAIDTALEKAMGGRSVAELTPYERAKDSLRDARKKV